MSGLPSNQESSDSSVPLRHSLNAKLMFAFLAVALLPLIGASIFSYVRSESTLQTKSVDLLVSNVSIVEISIERWLNERYIDVELLAQTDAIRSGDLESIAAELKRIFDSNSGYESLFFTGTDGMTLFATDGGTYDFSDHSYFTDAMQGGVAVSDPRFSVVTGDIVFVVAAPVYINEQIIGVVVAKTQLPHDLLISIRQGESGETYLINSDGYFVTPSRFTQDLIADGFITKRAELEMRVDSVASRAVLAGGRGHSEYPDYRGVMVLGAYAPIDFAGRQWGLISEVDSAEAFAQATLLRNQFVLVVLIGALIVIVAAILLARNISQPLKLISRTAARLALGDTQQEILYRSKDEVGLLADQFRRMIGYQQEMANAATHLAKGDLNVQVSPQSEKDALGHAFTQMVQYQKEMASAAEKLAVGNLDVQVKAQSEKDMLGNAFAQMVAYQQDIVGAVGEVAQGNLTVNVAPYSAQDVLSNAVQRMIAQLRNTVGSVQSSAQRLIASSSQLSQVSEQASDATLQITQTIEMMAGTTQQVAETIGQVALGAAQQAQVLERTRAIVDEQEMVIVRIADGTVRQTQSVDAADQIFHGQLAAAIQQVEVATNASGQAVSTAVGAAQSGSQAVGKTIAGINTVAKTAEQVTHRITEMGKRSQQIGAIVQVINEIAERTNLLSLNAAIEAARAGEHGKGFAVVADEVRKLAERSAKSAEEITELVGTVQEAARQAVAAMDENDRQVQQGLETANDAEQALTGIHNAMAQVGGQMQQLQKTVADLGDSSRRVQVAMQQVASVIEENMEAANVLTASHTPIQHAMEEIASVAEENSAAAEEVAASAEESSSSVEEINAMTKSVNAQVEEVTVSAQSVASVAAELQAVVAMFRLSQQNATQNGMTMSRQAESFSRYASNVLDPVTNGHTTNGHTTNGHTTNGHTTNGHTTNGHTKNGHNGRH